MNKGRNFSENLQQIKFDFLTKLSQFLEPLQSSILLLLLLGEDTSFLRLMLLPKVPMHMYVNTVLLFCPMPRPANCIVLKKAGIM